MYKCYKDYVCVHLHRRSSTDECSSIKKKKIMYNDAYSFTLSKKTVWIYLNIDNIELPDVFTFKARLKRLNNEYVDLLQPLIIFIGQLSSCQNPELFNVYLHV